LDELGNVIRNKGRLVAQSYTQIERINFEETYAPVARLGTIQMTIAFASFKNFKLSQINVKSSFFYGFMKRRCMLNNPLGLLILHIWILFLNLKRLCMV